VTASDQIPGNQPGQGTDAGMLKSGDRSRSGDISRPIFDGLDLEGSGLSLGLEGSGLGLEGTSLDR